MLLFMQVVQGTAMAQVQKITLSLLVYGFFYDAGVYCNFYISSANKMTVLSGQQEVGTVSVYGNDGSEIICSIIGGADENKFSIDSATGVLHFITAPDVSDPQDRNGDITYRVRVKAKHPNIFDSMTISVTVKNSSAIVPIISYMLF